MDDRDPDFLLSPESNKLLDEMLASESSSQFNLTNNNENEDLPSDSKEKLVLDFDAFSINISDDCFKADSDPGVDGNWNWDTLFMPSENESMKNFTQPMNRWPLSEKSMIKVVAPNKISNQSQDSFVDEKPWRETGSGWQCLICKLCNIRGNYYMGMKIFRFWYALSRHMPCHTRVRNYVCDVCEKTFRQMSTLSQHRTIHSEERNHSCDVCAKKFNRQSTLISHRKTHSSFKPHKCTMCDKSFHQKGNLRNHMFTHTNERPYKCDLCPKGFNQRSNLMCHKAHAHSEVGSHPCSRCNFVFSKRIYLREHEAAVHGISYPGLLLSNPNQHYQFPNPNNYNLTYGAYQMQIHNESTTSGIPIENLPHAILRKSLENPKATLFALIVQEDGKHGIVRIVRPQESPSNYLIVPVTEDDIILNFKMCPLSSGGTQYKIPLCAIITPMFDDAGRIRFIIKPTPARQRSRKTKKEDANEESVDVPRLNVPK